MKILVISDSHGGVSALNEALQRSGKGAELVIFLGDGLKDIAYCKSAYPSLTFFEVRGNCDFMCADTPIESVLELDGVRVLITHGHKYNVKHGLSQLLEEAVAKDVDAVLFGHTHMPTDLCEYVGEKRIQLFNPGSLGYGKTYGVINTANGVLVTNIIDLYGEKH